MDTAQHYVTAVNSLAQVELARQQLELENNKLIQGAANQAKTIRTLQERISELESKVTLAEYNVEFLKNQGRKTRVIHRTKIKALKARAEAVRKPNVETEYHVHQLENLVARLQTQVQGLGAELQKQVARNEKLMAPVFVPMGYPLDRVMRS